MAVSFVPRPRLRLKQRETGKEEGLTVLLRELPQILRRHPLAPQLLIEPSLSFLDSLGADRPVRVPVRAVARRHLPTRVRVVVVVVVVAFVVRTEDAGDVAVQVLQ